ncbi:MAG: peptidylprolyl isomerase [Pirellulales bacterium]|nr:peptidylprolyl isomerase [Pirellulales bacterium]
MRKWSHVTCVLAVITCITVATVGIVAAQDGTQATGQQTGGGQPGKAAQEFDALFAQWRTKLDAMRKLQVDYKQSRPEDRPAMEQQFDQLLGEAKEMSVQLQALIEAAYRENPEDQEKAKFLESLAFLLFKEDKFEESLRLWNVLLDRSTDRRGQHLDYAGQCQYLLNDYSTAQKTLEDAEKELAGRRPLSAEAQSMRANLDLDRQAWEAELAAQKADEKPSGDALELPRVQLETSTGMVVIELFENEAPNTVANFITLVRKGFYDGLEFYRVVEGESALVGDPTNSGNGGAGYEIPFEASEEPYRKHFRGSVSMARQAISKETASSQFFITFRRDNARQLDGEYTVFGRVVEGMDTVTKFARPDARSEDGTISEPDRIIKATVLNARDHEYKFRKVGDPEEGTDAAGSDSGGNAAGGGDGSNDTGAGDGGSGGGSNTGGGGGDGGGGN